MARGSISSAPCSTPFPSKSASFEWRRPSQPTSCPPSPGSRADESLGELPGAGGFVEQFGLWLWAFPARRWNDALAPWRSRMDFHEGRALLGLGEDDLHVPAHGGSEPKEAVELRRSQSGNRVLEAADDRLAGPHQLGNLLLGQPGGGPHLENGGSDLGDELALHRVELPCVPGGLDLFLRGAGHGGGHISGGV